MNRSLILSSVALLALAACGEAEKATNEAESAAADVAADTTAAVENATADVTGSTAPADATAASGYATNAALGDMFEIESSRLAVEKAKSPEVKKFAQMMIDRLPVWSHSQPESGEAATAAIPDAMKSRPIRSTPIAYVVFSHAPT